MRALTIRQPWASLIAAGVKTIETRSWSTKYRGPLAIHAGRSEAVIAAVGNRDVWDAWGATGYVDDGGVQPGPLGAVVATCTLADVVPIVDFDEMPVAPYVRTGKRLGLRLADVFDGQTFPTDITEQRPLGDFTPGRFAWLLTDITPCDPVPAKGKQGLWTWDPTT